MKKRELLCWKKVKFRDRTEKRFSIYKEGNSEVIVDPISRDEYSLHPSSRNVDDEIKVLFSVQEIETEYPTERFLK